MSRIGKKPINIPKDATVKIVEGNVIVSGPKGQLRQKIEPEIEVKIGEGQILVLRKSDNKKIKALHGLTKSLITNMIEGVNRGFSKSLVIRGTGYRAVIEEGKLKLRLGFSHPIIVEPPEEIKLELEGKNIIKVFGIDKYLVGQVAANIRAIHKPEPYKGKGIRYKDEKVRRKAGKVVKTGLGGA